MKKLILISALLFSFNGLTQVPDEVHEKCKDVADYVGCVQIFTGSLVKKKETEIPEIKELKKALGLLASRLQNTSLRDLSLAIQPFTDALAYAEIVSKDESYSIDDRTKLLELIIPSIRIDNAIDIFYRTRSKEIEYEAEVGDGIFTHWRLCSKYDDDVTAFNRLFKREALSYDKLVDRAFNNGIGIDYDCRVEFIDEMGSRKSSIMLSIIIRSISYALEGKELQEYEVRSLQEQKDEYVNMIVDKTKKDISEFKKLNQEFDNPYTVSNFVTTYTKKEFRELNRNLRQIAQKIEKGGEIIDFIIDDQTMPVYIGGLSKSELKDARDLLNFQYSIDYQLADQKKWSKNLKADGMYFGKLYSIMRLSLFITRGNLNPNNLDNNLEVRKILIGALSIDLENCTLCYDPDGRPNLSYDLLFQMRKGVKDYLENVERIYQ